MFAGKLARLPDTLISAYTALRWFRDSFAPNPPADAILEVDQGWANEQTTYYVRVSRVLEHYGREHQEFFSKHDCPQCNQEFPARGLKRHLLEVHGRAS